MANPWEMNWGWDDSGLDQPDIQTPVTSRQQLASQSARANDPWEMNWDWNRAEASAADQDPRRITPETMSITPSAADYARTGEVMPAQLLHEDPSTQGFVRPKGEMFHAQSYVPGAYPEQRPITDNPEWWELAPRGLIQGAEDIARTGYALAGGDPRKVPALPMTNLNNPITVSEAYEDPARAVGQAATMVARMWPMAVGGYAGGALGTATEVGAVGSEITGMAGGTMIGTFAQSMGPRFAAALEQYPDDPEKAWKVAGNATLIDVGSAGAGGLLFGATGNTLKGLMFQIFGIQPAVGVANMNAVNAYLGQDDGLTLADQYLNNLAPALLQTGVERAVHAVTPRGAPPAGPIGGSDSHFLRDIPEAAQSEIAAANYGRHPSEYEYLNHGRAQDGGALDGKPPNLQTQDERPGLTPVNRAFKLKSLEVMDKIPDKKMSGEAWHGRLLNLGVKPEEMSDLGLTKMLSTGDDENSKKSWTREQVLSQINANNYPLHESIRREAKSLKRYRLVNDNGKYAWEKTTGNGDINKNTLHGTSHDGARFDTIDEALNNVPHNAETAFNPFDGAGPTWVRGRDHLFETQYRDYSNGSLQTPGLKNYTESAYGLEQYSTDMAAVHIAEAEGHNLYELKERARMGEPAAKSILKDINDRAFAATHPRDSSIVPPYSREHSPNEDADRGHIGIDNQSHHTRGGDMVNSDGVTSRHIEEVQSDNKQRLKNGVRTRSQKEIEADQTANDDILDSANYTFDQIAGDTAESDGPFGSAAIGTRFGGRDGLIDALEAHSRDGGPVPDGIRKMDRSGVELTPEMAGEYASKLKNAVVDYDEASANLLAMRDERRLPKSMPQTKSWGVFALKREIQRAIADGLTRITWTTGEQQAKRYGFDEARSKFHRNLYDKKMVEWANDIGRKFGIKARKVAIPVPDASPLSVSYSEDEYSANTPAIRLEVIDFLLQGVRGDNSKSMPARAAAERLGHGLLSGGGVASIPEVLEKWERAASADNRSGVKEVTDAILSKDSPVAKYFDRDVANKILTDGMTTDVWALDLDPRMTEQYKYQAQGDDTGLVTDGDRRDRKVSLTPDVEKKSRKLIAELRAIVNRINPLADVGFVQRMLTYRRNGKVSGVNGAALYDMVALALDHRNMDPEGTSRHEANHTVVDLMDMYNLWKPGEREALHASHVETGGWADRNDARRDFLRQYVPADELSGEKPYSKTTLNNVFKEAVAQEHAEGVHERWVNQPKPVRKIFYRIDGMLKEIRNAVKRVFGKKLSGDDILSMIDSGVMGRRLLKAADRGTYSPTRLVSHATGLSYSVTPETNLYNVFDSALDTALDTVKLKKAPGVEWRAVLIKNGVKPEELRDSGMEAFFAQNNNTPITADDVRAHRENNRIELHVVKLSDGTKTLVRPNGTGTDVATAAPAAREGQVRTLQELFDAEDNVGNREAAFADHVEEQIQDELNNDDDWPGTYDTNENPRSPYEVRHNNDTTYEVASVGRDGDVIDYHDVYDNHREAARDAKNSSVLYEAADPVQEANGMWSVKVYSEGDTGSTNPNDVMHHVTEGTEEEAKDAAEEWIKDNEELYEVRESEKDEWGVWDSANDRWEDEALGSEREANRAAERANEEHHDQWYDTAFSEEFDSRVADRRVLMDAATAVIDDHVDYGSLRDVASDEEIAAALDEFVGRHWGVGQGGPGQANRAVSSIKFASYNLTGGTHRREYLITAPSLDTENLSLRTHFGGAARKIVSHVRASDFATEDGGVALNLEESQSDPAQDASEARQFMIKGLGIKASPSLGFGGESEMQISDGRDRLHRERRAIEENIDALVQHAQSTIHPDDRGAKEVVLQTVIPSERRHYLITNGDREAFERADPVDLGVRGDVRNAVRFRFLGRKISAMKKRMAAIDKALSSTGRGAVAPARFPHRDTWHVVQFKMMLHEAILKGYDYLTMTTGEQQVARYRSALTEAVQGYHFKLNDDRSKVTMKITLSDGREHTLKDSTQAEVAAHIGNEEAESIFTASNPEGVRPGSGIQFGSPGIINHYNRDIPSDTKKFLAGMNMKWGKIAIGRRDAPVTPLPIAAPPPPTSVTLFHRGYSSDGALVRESSYAYPGMQSALAKVEDVRRGVGDSIRDDGGLRARHGFDRYENEIVPDHRGDGPYVVRQRVANSTIGAHSLILHSHTSHVSHEDAAAMASNLERNDAVDRRHNPHRPAHHGSQSIDILSPTSDAAPLALPPPTPAKPSFTKLHEVHAVKISDEARMWVQGSPTQPGKRFLRYQVQDEAKANDPLILRRIDEENFRRLTDGTDAVNPDGSPMLMAHATNAPTNFTAFKIADHDIGVHVGTPEQARSRYMKGTISNWREFSNGWRTIPVYIAVRKPLVLPDMDSWTFRSLGAHIASEYPELARDVDSIASLGNSVSVAEETKMLRQALIAHGYDAIKYVNKFEPPGMGDAEDAAHAASDRLRESLDDPNSTGAERAALHTKAFDAIANVRALMSSATVPSYAVLLPSRIKVFSNEGSWSDRVDEMHLQPQAPVPQGLMPADPRVNEPRFKAFFKASHITDAVGHPLRVYHGAMHEVKSFRPGNPEGFFGGRFYFTTDSSDASNNYANVKGGDVQVKRDQWIEKNNVERLSTGGARTIPDEQMKERWLNEAVDNHGVVYPVYLSIQNPVYIGGPNETMMKPKAIHRLGLATIKAARDMGVRKQEAGILYDALEKLAMDYDPQDNVRMKTVVHALRDHEAAYDMTDNTGALIFAEVLRAALEAQGYDGIVDSMVGSRWPSMNIGPDEKHIIAFRPNQIKGVFNRGTWSSRMDDTMYQHGDDGSGRYREAYEDPIESAASVNNLRLGFDSGSPDPAERIELSNRKDDLLQVYRKDWLDMRHGAGHVQYAIMLHGRPVGRLNGKVSGDRFDLNWVGILGGDDGLGDSSVQHLGAMLRSVLPHSVTKITGIRARHEQAYATADEPAHQTNEPASTAAVEAPAPRRIGMPLRGREDPMLEYYRSLGAQ